MNGCISFNIGPIDTKLQIFYNLNVLFLTMWVSCWTDSYPVPLDLKLGNGLKLEKGGLTFSSFNAMPVKTTKTLLSKKEVCVTRTIAITADNFSFISFPVLSGWRCQNGKCYLYVRDTVTWDWAQQRCRSRNATLVTISSSSENSFVASLIKTNVWIGLNDRVEAGTWDYLGFINQPVICLRYLLAHSRTQTVIFQWYEQLYKMHAYEQYRKEMRQKTCLVYWSASYIFDGMLFETHVSGYFWIRNLSFPDTASVHMHPVNPAYESATFLIRSPEWKFLNRLWIRNR